MFGRTRKRMMESKPQGEIQSTIKPKAKRLSKDMNNALEVWDNIASMDMDDSMLDNPRFSEALDSLEGNIHGMNNEIQKLLKAMREM